MGEAKDLNRPVIEFYFRARRNYSNKAISRSHSTSTLKILIGPVGGPKIFLPS